MKGDKNELVYVMNIIIIIIIIVIIIIIIIIIKLGGGVRPTSKNPYPIYDQNQRYSVLFMT